MPETVPATIHGRCHCGAITYRFNPTCPADALPVRACTCSFCRAHGARYGSDPQGSLVIDIPDLSLVHPYSFGTRTASFLVCRCCGLVPAVLSRLDGHLYGVPNLAVATTGDFLGRPFTHRDFEGEALTERLARRRKTWIAQVVCPEGLEIAGG